MIAQSGIYRIDLCNGLIYIGSSNDLRTRKYNHLRSLNANNHYNRRVQRNFTKYGVFEFVIIEICPEADLLLREQFYLDVHYGTKKCANACPIAGRVTGTKHPPRSAAMRRKMSERAKTSPIAIAQRARLHALPISDSTREAMSRSAKGKPKSIAHRRAIAAGKTGTALSVSHRKSMSVARTGYPVSDTTRQAISDGLNAHYKQKKAAT